MEKNTAAAFRDVLRRIYAQENLGKYQAICIKTRCEDEERVWKLCEAFWPAAYSDRTFDIDSYEPNPNLDNATARRYINELHQLLDKLGWE